MTPHGDSAVRAMQLVRGRVLNLGMYFIVFKSKPKKRLRSMFGVCSSCIRDHPIMFVYFGCRLLSGQRQLASDYAAKKCRLPRLLKRHP